MALTTIGISNLRPKKADYRVTDGGGLLILVRPNVSKLWRYDYQLGGSAPVQSVNGVKAQPGLVQASPRRA